jgi:oxygen-independent coproporphyrinogen-3 oxidase
VSVVSAETAGPSQNGERSDYRHVYVHVPFCARRCSYCDFAIAVRRNVPSGEYVDALAREFRARRLQLNAPVNTLYFGGGTPSSLGGDGVARAMEWAHSVMQLTPNAEVTLEANPEDINPDSVDAWKRAGINRLSIGMQSFDDRVLQWMHRVHNADASLRAAQIARDGGIDAFSIDLIFSLPASLEREWNRDVDIALSLNADHISLYGLTVEPHTPLGRWESRGEVVAADEDAYEEQFLLAHDRLNAAGYEHYEVSNFGRPGKRARHNSAYWHGVPYLGLGPSAHGFNGAVRRWNEPAFAAWERAALEGIDPIGGSEELTAENRLTESVYLGLRTVDGLLVESHEVPQLAPWFENGWVEWIGPSSESRIRCTALGWLRLDALAGALTASRSR